MARDRDRDRDRKRSNKDLGRRAKKRVCIFCKDKVDWVDYKDVNLLRRFISDRGKIRARRVSGNCAQHQRDVAVAIKTARELALLPYSQRTMSERGAPRGPRNVEAAAIPADADVDDEASASEELSPSLAEGEELDVVDEAEDAGEAAEAAEAAPAEEGAGA
jgi:small subunit ribosomal protein S18